MNSKPPLPASTKILDGRLCSSQIRAEISAKIQRLEPPIAPHLVVVRIGDDPASAIYVRAKQRASAEVGIRSTEHHLEATTTAEELGELIDQLNADDDVDGILLQLPLPEHLESRVFLDRIDAHKDIDGFHPLNIGRMLTGSTSLLVPCTPLGVMELLRRNDISLTGKHAVIIGRSQIVGKPMSLMLDDADCTVTLCHHLTKDLRSHVERAEILVVATGHAHLVPGSWLKPGVVVVDVGTSRLPNGKLIGDVVFDEAVLVASAITPVPGGVGPMTVAMLLHQTLLAAIARRGLVLSE